MLTLSSEPFTTINLQSTTMRTVRDTWLLNNPNTLWSVTVRNPGGGWVKVSTVGVGSQATESKKSNLQCLMTRKTKTGTRKKKRPK